MESLYQSARLFLSSKMAFALEITVKKHYILIMRKVLPAILFFTFFVLLSKDTFAAARYATCDVCGLCRNTTLSMFGVASLGIPEDSSVYQKPSNWELCFKCLYPTQAAQPATQEPCENTIKVINTKATPELVTNQNCQSILIDDARNDYKYKPQTGRFYSDVGCISTGVGSFVDPNASVDVVKRILDIVTSVTGAIGLIYFIKGAIQLLTSRGNTETIAEGKKTLMNTLIGVAFTLFALFIFRFIAEQALRIPGLS